MNELPPFLTVKEVSELLRVNRETIYDAVNRGELKAIRVGRAVRIPRSVIEPMLTNEPKETEQP